MSTTTDLTTLKINYLTQEQYDDAVDSGEINENEIYLTPIVNSADVKITDAGYDSATKTLQKMNGSYVRNLVTLSDVAISNDYEDLDNLPVIPTDASDIDAVPITRTVNGKALSSDVTLAASDVGAPSSSDFSSLSTRVGATEDGYTSLSGRMDTVEDDIDTLDARVDQIVAPSGEAPSSAEVADARIGADSTTYTSLGLAIRTQVSDLADAIGKDAPALNAAPVTIVPNNTNYNTLLTSGNYRVQNAANAQTMINCPTTSAHRLFIVEMSAGRILQIVMVNISTTLTFMRYYNGTTWSDWNCIAFTKDIQNSVCVDQTNISLIPQNTDYNTLTTVGAYEVRSSANAKSMTNCPVKYGHRLYVTKLYTGSSRTYQLIVAADPSMTQYVRRLDAYGNWTSWVSEALPDTAKYTPLYNEFTNEFSLNVSRIKFGGTAMYSTLPIETRVLGQTDYYDEGAPIDSVVYSSVWRDGLDVYRNFSLETFYSALANPASVLYTKTYTDRNIVNAHAWYGGVCSTYVTKILGIRQYKTTSQLEDFLEPKQILDYHDVAVGDALLTSGHIAFISQIYLDSDGALNGFGVSEQTSVQSVGFRTQIIALKDFDAYLKRGGYTIMTVKEDTPTVTLDDPRFNSEIIFERGNNTYITEDELADEGAWFYIPTLSDIYWKKDDGAFESLNLSALPTKTVNGVTVYNLSSCFDGVGDYTFTDGVDSLKMCLVKLINVGTIDLDGNVLTISDWENCVPYNYYIVKEIERTSPDQSSAMNPTSGYVCGYTNKCGNIDVEASATEVTVEIPEDDLVGLDRYKLWLEYDTGIGYKQAWTNLVIVS